MVTIWPAIFPSAIVWTLRSIRCRTNRAARLTAHWSLWHVLSLKKIAYFCYIIFFLIVIYFVQFVLRIIFQLSILIINFCMFYLRCQVRGYVLSRSQHIVIVFVHDTLAKWYEKFFFLFLLKMLYLKLFRLIFPAACITRQNTHVNYVSCMMGSHAMLCQKSSARWDISRWFEEHMDDSIAV